MSLQIGFPGKFITTYDALKRLFSRFFCIPLIVNCNIIKFRMCILRNIWDTYVNDKELVSRKIILCRYVISWLPSSDERSCTWFTGKYGITQFLSSNMGSDLITTAGEINCSVSLRGKSGCLHSCSVSVLSTDSIARIVGFVFFQRFYKVEPVTNKTLLLLMIVKIQRGFTLRMWLHLKTGTDLTYFTLKVFSRHHSISISNCRYSFSNFNDMLNITFISNFKLS